MFEQQANYYKALAEPTRLQILHYLLKQGSCVCICEVVKHIQKDQSVISRHVQTLAQAGLINANKDGRHLHCCIADKTKTKKLLEETP